MVPNVVPNVFPILLTLALSSLVSAQTANSIAGSNPYNQQRACIKACLWGFPAGGDLSIQLGCSAPWVNECYCRADLKPAASSILSKCVYSQCGQSATVDVSLALSVYDGYCTTALPGIAAVSATTTLADPNSPTVTVVIVTTSTTSPAGTSFGNAAATAAGELASLLGIWLLLILFLSALAVRCRLIPPSPLF